MTINVFQPCLGDDEMYALSDVFRSGWLGAGQYVEKFTEKFASRVGKSPDQFVTVSSATDGLFLAMELIDVRGYEVVLPTIHFVGAANAVVANGGHPSFCDVDPLTLNPRLEHIEAVVTPDTKVVCLIHYGGRPCDDIFAIRDFCEQNEIWLIEDSSCSLDSYLRGMACGVLGNIGIWSFDPMKLLSCGDGGMMYFHDREMARRTRSAAFFGISKKSGLSASSDMNSRWWEFEVERAGRYSSMNDIDAAIMLKQLESLPDFKKQRAMVDSIYRRCLASNEDITLCPPVQDGGVHSHYFFWIQTPLRDQLASYLKERDVYTTFRYYPLHRVKFYRDRRNNYPGADYAADNTLLLPIHAALAPFQAVEICQKIRDFFALVKN